MDNLYDQLLALQHIPDAYLNWADYRNMLTSFIIKNTKPDSSALILGAGASNDLDLVRFLKHFSSLALLDKNVAAMQEGIRRQLPEEVFQAISSGSSEGLTLVPADLLGIADDACCSFCDRLLGALRSELSGRPDPERFQNFLLKELTLLLGIRKEDPDLKKLPMYDYVVCCGVHSQLLSLFPQIAVVFCRYLPFDVRPVFEMVSRCNMNAAATLNETILSHAEKGFLLALETERPGIVGGVEGAAQAFYDLAKRSLIPTAEAELLWPFDPAQQKYYRMKLLSFSR